MSSMANLTQFVVASNLLSGPLPSDWMSSIRLSFIDIAGNKLSGTIPQQAPANLLARSGELWKAVQRPAGGTSCLQR